MSDNFPEQHGPDEKPGAWCDQGCDAYCAMRHVANNLDYLGIKAEVEPLNDDELAIYLSAEDAAGLGSALDDLMACCLVSSDDPARAE